MSSRNITAKLCLTVAPLFILSLSTWGASLPSTAGPMGSANPQEREAFAENFVHQKLDVWQRRMNLNNWNLQVNLVRAADLEPQTLGNIHWDTDTKTAQIAVLSTYDYHLPYASMLNDMEFTIVHELVHLELASLPRSSASRREEEHAVNELARALLALTKK